jgi:hypothetical protein
MLSRFEELGWAKRDGKTRVVSFSREGEKRFNVLFGAPAE